MTIISQETVDIFRRAQEADDEDRKHEAEAADLLARVAAAIYEAMDGVDDAARLRAERYAKAALATIFP